MTTQIASIINKDYGEVLNSTLCEIFGSVLIYNDLKYISRRPNDTTYLEIRIMDNKPIEISLDQRIVLDIHQENDWNYNEMFYMLDQLEQEQLEQKQSDRLTQYENGEEFAVDVDEILIQDKKYHIDDCLFLYDIETNEMIGKYDKDSDSITLRVG